MSIIRNPNLYNGKNKKDNFFEGWYYKLVTKHRKYTLAIIPGISLSSDSHSFIQVLRGEDVLYDYFRFYKNDFFSSNSYLKINISNNSFSLDGIFLDLYNSKLKIKGSLLFSNLVKWSDSIINPGSMGFYNYLKFMECYSQVCALDGDIKGTLSINDNIIDFNDGKVYIEKNWGRSFPVEWLWIQSNTFKDSRATITCSLGEIPFPLKNFRGFLIGVTVDNMFFPFTTMNRSKLDLKVENDDILLTVIHKNLRLSLKTITDTNSFILCYGPKNGQMVPFVKETLTAKVQMELVDTKNNTLIYSGEGSNTGIEFGGNLM